MKAKTIVLLSMLSLFGAALASADDVPKGSKDFALFVSDPKAGSDFEGGLGVKIRYAWKRRWTTELAVAAERHKYFNPVAFDSLGHLDSRRVNVRSFPVSVLTRYWFANDSRWTPYVGAGVRHVPAPDARLTQFRNFLSFSIVDYPLHDRTSGVIEGGTTVRLTPRLALDFTLSGLARSDDVFYDPLLTPAVGLRWHF